MNEKTPKGKIDTNTQKGIPGFTWFGLWPTSTGCNKKKFH